MIPVTTVNSARNKNIPFNNIREHNNTLASHDDIPSFETLINSSEKSPVSSSTEQEYGEVKYDGTNMMDDNELLRQLTEVLEQVTAVNVGQQTSMSAPPNRTVTKVGVSGVTNSSLPKLNTFEDRKFTAVVPSTPHILDDILSFDSDDCDDSAYNSKLLSSVSEFCASLRKEQQEQAIQSSSTFPVGSGSPTSSDSDYESIHSPSSDTSENGRDSHFDCSTFDELFPALA